MKNLVHIEADRRKSKRYALGTTIIYLFLFPFSLLLAGASVMVFDSPGTYMVVGLAIISLYLCIALSMPLSLYFIWSRYLRRNYKNALQFCFIPLYVAVITFILETLVNIATK